MPRQVMTHVASNLFAGLFEDDTGIGSASNTGLAQLTELICSNPAVLWWLSGVHRKLYTDIGVNEYILDKKPEALEYASEEVVTHS